MNSRLSMLEFVGRLQAALPPNTAAVSHSKAKNYQTDFGKTFPAVWVLAQRARALNTDDVGSGYAGGLYRQHVAVEVAVRCVVQRYKDGQTDSEAPLNALMDAVITAFKKWQPTNADFPVRIVSMQDGPDHETVTYADIVFGTEITYEG